MSRAFAHHWTARVAPEQTLVHCGTDKQNLNVLVIMLKRQTRHGLRFIKREFYPIFKIKITNEICINRNLSLNLSNLIVSSRFTIVTYTLHTR